MSHSYARQLVQEDDTSVKKHLEALDQETRNSKPKERVLQPLMRSTFFSRWLYVKTDATCASEIIEKSCIVRAVVRNIT